MSDEPDTASGAAIGDPSPATAPADTGTEAPERDSRPADPSKHPPFTHTRASGYWAAVVVGLLVLLVLIIFILENGQRASVSFMGVHGHLPEGVALLLAAVIGGLFVVLAGAARILQLRTRARSQNTTSPRRRRSRQTSVRV
jgi:uncharacterized integral membrane protein